MLYTGSLTLPQIFVLLLALENKAEKGSRVPYILLQGLVQIEEFEVFPTALLHATTSVDNVTIACCTSEWGYDPTLRQLKGPWGTLAPIKGLRNPFPFAFPCHPCLNLSCA